MKKFYNERHVELEKMPSDLMVLDVLDRREALDTSLKKQLSRLSAKEKGFHKVMDALRKYGKEDWTYMNSVAIDYYGIITCDLLVMTSTHLYTLEINDFEGTFELKDGVSQLNGETLKEHPIAMTQSVLTQLKGSKLMTPNPIHLVLKGAAIFTNKKNSLDIQDDTSDIEVVKANQIINFVKRMVREEKQAKAKTKGVTFNPMHYSWIARIDRHHPCIPIEIPDTVLKNVVPGMVCNHCHGFNVEIGEILMTCECGGWDLVEDAILRTVFEYTVLARGEKVDIPSLLEFFNNQISKEQLDKLLDKIAEEII